MARFVDDERVRAARPPAADVDPHAFDAQLLASVMAQPVAPRRRRRVAIPAAVAVAGGVAAVVLLTGGGRPTPTASAAVARALTWFEPAPGTVLHMRSVLSSPGVPEATGPLVQEIWQSVDHPEQSRHIETQSGHVVENSDGDMYDPTTDTIYEAVIDPAQVKQNTRRALYIKVQAARKAGAPEYRIKYLKGAMKDPRPDPAPVDETIGDPTYQRIKAMLAAGKGDVGAEAQHDDVAALPITLDLGHGVRWVLWTAADDGRPLDLVIDHGDGTRVEEETRWTTYEVVPSSPALLTVQAAHPDAKIVHDAAAYQEASTRLYPHG